MDDRWNILPDARRVLQHEDDSRPAWLWSQDGQVLIWSNAAAALFGAKLKKHGLKRAAPAAPIKGQVARIIRLGAAGRTSLARIQFLAGEKPISATCATTPLTLDNGEHVLLIVGVDAIAPDILAAANDTTSEPQAGDASPAEQAEPPAMEAPPAEETEAPREPQAGDAAAAEGAEPPATEAPPADETETPGEPEPEDAAPNDDVAEAAADAAYARELQSWREADAESAYATAVAEEPADVATMGHDGPAAWTEALGDDAEPAPETGPGAPVLAWNVDDNVDATDAASDDANEDAGDPDASEQNQGGLRSLSDLVDRLAADEALYAPLTEADDFPPAAASDTPAPAEPEDPESEAILATFYKVTGRGFRSLRAEGEEPLADEPAEDPAPPAEDSPAAESEPDPETVERVSRYNFDELSRILTDRVGERRSTPAETAETTSGSTGTTLANAPSSTGSLVNLGGETLVLNRLPLGILVFRDQQVLFANRAITEMIGYDSVESLRNAGLAAIFPVMGSEGQEAGPVNHLVQRDGTLVPVTARLQSISWHGRPALMLSASTTEVRTGHEDAVRAFAETFADLRGDGFLEASRNGMVNSANAPAITLLAADGRSLVGKPLASLVGEDDAVALRAFLERPARFAESSRPCLTLRSLEGRADLMLFALGQAGIVSGYFALVTARSTTPARLGAPVDIDPALLGRISRGVRRPLNTVIGFSDIIRSKAFGALDNERYAAYADDIAQAGQEIAALVDELDDYARLRDGRYLPQRASLDLTDLLEQCVIRIRAQATSARVIVRNAISERLPRITADRASLAQAVLNLLSSAIDQTPAGGAVVISAQRHDDQSIAIHVRDSSVNAVDMAERFVVFRDGIGRNGKMLAPVRSSVGLALTRSLLAVNAVSLAVDPAGPEGMLFTLRIPADLVDERPAIREAD